MKIYLDTASISEIRTAVSYGFIDGVTTNPTLAAKEGVPYEQAVKQICSLIEGPVSAECVKDAANELIQEGFAISKWAKNVVVKIPVTWNGLRAAKALSAEGVRINMTLCFSPTQALLAAKAGASYISPFVGRIDDMGEDGMAVVADIVDIYRNYGIKTEVLAASIRHIGHVIAAAKAGAHIATMPFAVYDKLLHHPLTEKGINIFKNDYGKIPRS